MKIERTNQIGNSNMLTTAVELAAVVPTADHPPATAEGKPTVSGVADLIWRAKHSPPKPVIVGLLHEKEIAGLHGATEHMARKFRTDPAQSCGLGSKKKSGRWRSVFS